MRLVGDAHIRFNITIFGEEQLKAWRSRPTGTTTPAILGFKKDPDPSPDFRLLIGLLVRTAKHVTVTADPAEGPLYFEATLRDFPYTINYNGKHHFTAFGLVLAPVCGRVARVEVVSQGLGVAINAVVSTTDKTVIELDGILRLVIRHRKTDETVEVKPPATFKEERFYRTAS